ncbi:hypothetical protein [Nocardia sp. NBC_01009]|uniref:hypothetical protein n=1 Tax=Nocardia sp. NBC_01009 TaxID=2975996 RepID=UPI00386DF6B7|nr:hypothetical protein OHA42_04425 [Nocardia sp. NBC_01009]
MGDVDPVAGRIERPQEAPIRTRDIGSSTYQSVTVEVGSNGALHSIRLDENGERLPSRGLILRIVELHAIALSEADSAMRVPVAQLDGDPRIQEQQERVADALEGPATPEKPTSTPDSQSAGSHADSECPSESGSDHCPDVSEPTIAHRYFSLGHAGVQDVHDHGVIEPHPNAMPDTMDVYPPADHSWIRPRPVTQRAHQRPDAAPKPAPPEPIRPAWPDPAEYLEPMFPEGNVNYDDLAFAGDLLWDSWRTDPYD